MASQHPILFRENEDGTFDLLVDSRTREMDVEGDDLLGALRRARVSESDAWIESLNGETRSLLRYALP